VEDRKYYPDHLAFTRPSGDMLHEFLVVWKKQEDSLVTLFKLLHDSGADILLAHTTRDGEQDSNITSLFLDFTKASFSPAALKDEIAKLPNVTEVDFVNMNGSIFDKFYFPPTIFNNSRVLVMRLSPLLKIERRLRERLGTAGTIIMFEEGKSYAKEVLFEYKASLQTEDKQLILSNVVDGLRATGWGLFEFRQYSAGFNVVVKHPPVLNDPGPAESSFIRGMAAGIIESLFFKVVGVRDASYDHSKDTLSFVLLR
jgi:hypothetical protein